MNQDQNHMRSALALARQGLGRTWPNPSVGCVVVKDDVVLARARTADGGRPHAESIALQKAGPKARGADLYVTLEPCAHHGKTPPCIKVITESGIKRVVVAVSDPDQNVAGQGIEQLKQNGVIVELGILAEQARDLYRGYFIHREKARPLVSLKMATTQDGYAANTANPSEWITGSLARRRGHLERLRHDGILVGIGTVFVDNPTLTTRLDGVDIRSPRIVLDTNLRFETENNLINSVSTAPLWIITTADQNEGRAQKLKNLGADIISVNANDAGQVDLNEAMRALADRGLTSVLVEGGPKIHRSFIDANLCDRFLWFRAPGNFGGEGLPALPDMDVSALPGHLNLKHRGTVALAQDSLDIYARAA